MCSVAAAAQSAPRVATPPSSFDTPYDFSVRETRPTGCIAELVPPKAHRVLVTLAATMDPRTDSVFTLQADLIAQDVAAEIRKSFGPSGEGTPEVDGRIQWYSIPAQLVIIVRPDGSMQWRTRGYLGDSSAATLLTNAFEAARAAGNATMLWPEGGKADSMVVRLSLAEPFSGEGDALEPGEKRVKFAVFTLPMPYETPAIPEPGQAPPQYPVYNEASRVAGSLIMQLVVDSSGRAIPSTIHDEWPAGKPQLTGEMGRYYREFVYSVTQWEKHLRYSPARIGGCAVNQLIQQPLSFISPNHTS
jgi:hypothetical protein